MMIKIPNPVVSVVIIHSLVTYYHNTCHVRLRCVYGTTSVFLRGELPGPLFAAVRGAAIQSVNRADSSEPAVHENSLRKNACCLGIVHGASLDTVDACLSQSGRAVLYQNY